MNNDNLKIPYGVSDFKRLRSEGFYFVDKSAYIRTLELCGSFLFFVRPRRFGKSLFLNMLRCYYDLAEKDNFDALFGDLDIGKNPTENRNRYQVLTLDFSQVNKGKGDTLEERFENYIGDRLDEFMLRYGRLYEDDFRAVFASAKPASKFTKLVSRAQTKDYHLYLMLDEYDNFTNAMLRAEGSVDYRTITHGQGFYREWFKSFKGNFDRIFMTGVSPVTMDDLTSGFNIASNISQSPLCNSMVGFSEAEVLKLYSDFKGTGMFTDGEPADFVRAIKPWYDGYCFARKKRGEESVFNSDMSLYYLNALVQTGEPPEDWVDRNIATDYDKLETIAEIQRRIDPERAENVMSPIEALAAEGEISFPLKESFDADAIREPDNFLSLFYYYGIITMKERREGADWFKIPNVCVKRQVFDYLRSRYEHSRSPNWQEWAHLARMFAHPGRAPHPGLHAGGVRASRLLPHGPRNGAFSRVLRLLSLPGTLPLRRRTAQLPRGVEVLQGGRLRSGPRREVPGRPRPAREVSRRQVGADARARHDPAPDRVPVQGLRARPPRADRRRADAVGPVRLWCGT